MLIGNEAATESEAVLISEAVSGCGCFSSSNANIQNGKGSGKAKSKANAKAKVMGKGKGKESVRHNGNGGTKGRSSAAFSRQGTISFLQKKLDGTLPTKSIGSKAPDEVEAVSFLDICRDFSDNEGKKRETRSRGLKAGNFQRLLDDHYRVFSNALELELQEEMGEMNTRIKNWTRKQLEGAGLALFDLQVSHDVSSIRDSILRFKYQKENHHTALPPHSFAPGDVVFLSKGSPEDTSLQATVVDFSTKWLRVALPMNLALDVKGDGWRIDLGAKTTTFERCMNALQEFKIRMPEDGAVGTFRRTLADTTSVEDRASNLPRWMRPPGGKKRLNAVFKEAESDAWKLNDSQVEAVQNAFKSTLSLWQGPPGTGKTYTLCAFIAIAVKELGPSARMLVTASSNVAVDNLVIGLTKLGVKVVRMGQPMKASMVIKGKTLDAQISRTELGRKMISMREKALSLKGEKRNEIWQEANELEGIATQQILDRVPVVASTCISAGDSRLEGRKFTIGVLDEATQATEPESLVALLSRVESAVLVGDGQQLAPTVKCLKAADMGLNISLFERLQALGLEPKLLDTQYRMHPIIAEFSSNQFYSGRVKSGIGAKDRPPIKGVRWVDLKKPVKFVNVDGVEARKELLHSPNQTHSYMNSQEASRVMILVQTIINTATKPQDIGVITPYKAQVKHIQSRFAKKGVGVMVATVDGFQGMEKEVIIFSAVRCNARKNVGFLSDHRRLNVAITRARTAFIVIGNERTLSRDKNWKSWFEWLDKHGILKKH